MQSVGTGKLFSTRSRITSPHLTPRSVDTNSTVCPPQDVQHWLNIWGVQMSGRNCRRHCSFRKSIEEQDRNVHGTLWRCQDTGLKLNTPDKSFVKQEKIRSFGVVCGPPRWDPARSKQNLITEKMSAPANRKELQTFLGLAKYIPLGPFIPNLNTLTSQLRELLKESHQFDWSPAQQEAY